MKLLALGGALEVGRSGFLLEDSGVRVLLDYGVKLQEGPIRRQEYPLPLPVRIDALILSHAHLDHCGFLPVVYKRQAPATFMTPVTVPLAKLLLEDSIKVARKQGIEPPFSKGDIRALMRNIYAVPYNKRVRIKGDVYFYFKDAGHIPGSALTLVEFPKKRILYTGDFNLTKTKLQNPADFDFRNIDVLIIESTYGDRDHPDREMEERAFLRRVEETVANGGIALVPVFAVGRAQEILMILDKLNLPVYLDGMAKDASDIIMSYPEYVSDPLALERALSKAVWVHSNRKRDEALARECVIVTTAGMIQGGPVLYYLPEIKDNPKNSILFVGYQVPGTPGREILERKVWRWDGYEFKIRAKVRRFDFSAHAGRKELLRAVKSADPEKVVLVHGDADVIEKFRQELESQGYDVLVPRIGQVYEV